MKSRIKIYSTIGIILALILIVWYATKPDTQSSTTITAPVKKGNFVISVSTTGELEAKSSEKKSSALHRQGFAKRVYGN